MQEVEVARPQTHDLNVNHVLSTQCPYAKKLWFPNWKDDIFFSKIILEADGKVIEIDARPSRCDCRGITNSCPIQV